MGLPPGASRPFRANEVSQAMRPGVRTAATCRRGQGGVKTGAKMRGFSGGALAGVAVGAAALAGLSLLAPPSAGPGEIGVVAEVGEAAAPETPPVGVAGAEVPVPSEPPLLEAAPETRTALFGEACPQGIEIEGWQVAHGIYRWHVLQLVRRRDASR